MSATPALRQDGQASVELVALLPLIVAVVVGAATVVAAGAAHRAAIAAAQAGALAVLQGRDPADAARTALAGWPPRHRVVHVREGRVTVTVRPRIPAVRIAALLAATSTAHAGTLPAGSPVAPRGGDGAHSSPATHARETFGPEARPDVRPHLRWERTPAWGRDQR